MIAFLEPAVPYLVEWWVFYPLCVLLLLVGSVALPEDHVRSRDYDAWNGIPFVSVLCNVLLFLVVGRYLGYSVDDLHRQWPLASGLAAFYLLFGIVWSFDRWRRLCVRYRDQIVEKITAWCDRHSFSYANIKTDSGQEHVRVSFYKFLYDESGLTYYGKRPYMEYQHRQPGDDTAEGERQDRYAPLPWAQVIKPFVPQVMNHKALVITWLLCWPLSVVKWLFAQALTDVVNLIFNSLKNQFQHVANHTFKDM
jgi:hypothetical protein